MGRRREKNTWAAIIIGPAIIGGSVLALWKNEHRFDYHKAAASTEPAAEVRGLNVDQVFSYTGGMDQGLTMQGQYVESFTGYLTVKRSAEIYAWHESEDDDGGTDWDRRWMNSVENNSRNGGINQQLSSNRFIPRTFQTGDLEINTDRVEFVDRFESITPSDLDLSSKGREQDLELRENYFYLAKGKSDNLGDERLSYRALPVPSTATYFGKYGGSQAVAHQAEVREGFISSIIKDTGVLHHLVAGERAVALSTMKAHIRRLKMIVRGVGLVVNVLGWAILFSFFTRFLVHIPVIGELMQWGAFLLSVVFGLTVGTVTIVTAWVTSQPIMLVGILVASVGALFMLRRKARSSQESLRGSLEAQVGYGLSPEQLKEMEFLELIRLAGKDGQVDVSETKYLGDWGQRQGWDDAKIATLVERALTNLNAPGRPTTSRDHLLQLVRLALADGTLSGQELKTIRKAAKDIDCSRRELSQLIAQARRGAAPAYS
jgi:hypothetical protein